MDRKRDRGEMIYFGRLEVHVVIPDLEEYRNEVDQRDVVTTISTFHADKQLPKEERGEKRHSHIGC
jgi:hypothetical protein